MSAGEKDVITSSEAAAATELTPEQTASLDFLKRQKDEGYLSLVRDVLKEAGYEPCPSWLKVRNIFEADLAFTDESTARISVMSHGARTAQLLDPDIFELQQISRKVDLMMKKSEANKVEPDLEAIRKLGDRSAFLAHLRMAVQLASIITEWSGPLFNFTRKFKTYEAGEAMPCLCTLDLTKPDQQELAREIISQLPDKVVQLAQRGASYLNDLGITGSVTRGN